MRKVIIAIISLLIFCNEILAQDINFPIDTTTGKINFSEVIYVDSASKLLLFTKAREWFTKSFTSSKSVLELEDKEAGNLLVKVRLEP